MACATIPACVRSGSCAIGRWLADSASVCRRCADRGSPLLQSGTIRRGERAALEAARVPTTADAARLVLGRVQLERYRATHSRRPVRRHRLRLRISTRDALNRANGSSWRLVLPKRCTSKIDSALPRRCSRRSSTRPTHLGRRRTSACSTGGPRRSSATHNSGRRLSGPSYYGRVSKRMREEICDGRRDRRRRLIGWRAAARGVGDLGARAERSHGGVDHGPLCADDGGVALRADLDRLVVQGILPDRAARLTMRDHTQALAGMVGEWEAFKSSWSR